MGVYIAMAALLMPPSHAVIASREGLVGKRTASGLIIKPNSIFAALPSRRALGRTVIVTYNGRSIAAPVLDVGPHFVRNPYWLSGARPLAEKRKGNKAGIDLSDALWDYLGIPRGMGLARVTWRFK
jgi:hypothetical protein